MNGSVERKPDDFDWVTARNDCSASVIFEKLRALIESDVDIRMRQRKKDGLYFRFASVGANHFSVIVEQQLVGIHDSVHFTIKNGEISVDGTRGNVFKLTVTLSDDGECRARISGREYDLWQVRKMALEDFFFGNCPG